MAHFIFSVLVVFLWLVAWCIYLVFGKRVKHPNAKAIGLPDVRGEFGSHSVSLIIGILQSLSSNAFPTSLTHHIL
ncbi:hypothetical protein MPG56_01260 [Helicobacter pylori]|uniref:hypothetical protein n=1 Tax=Helicobacter pylori TaxID=210 RepID=UPI001FD3F7BE|nr:hypothetical protein [Helicobacter pylori]UOR47983.1 hypothetical protein MPG56_01260 [Helicobacter pylori]